MQAGFENARVLARHDWAEGLMTLTIDLVPPGMTAGQFVNLGVEHEGKFLRRSYSIASAEGAPLEVYVTLVAEGVLTPGLFGLQPGDELPVDPKPHGFFTLQRIPQARDLWLVGTGTGLGPYVSMLRSGSVLERFESVVVVHGVRYPEHLSYADEIREWGTRSDGRIRYVPVVSRAEATAIHGRITTALEAGSLEERAGLELSPEQSHVMLCGNPAMITEMIQLLGSRGLKKHRTRDPGHVTFEKYWS